MAENINQNTCILRLDRSNKVNSSETTKQAALGYKILAKHFFLVADHMGGPGEVKPRCLFSKQLV